MAGRYGASDAPRIDAPNPLETPAPLRTIGPVRAVTTPLSDVVAAPFAVGADTGCANAALRVTGGGHFTARVGIGVCPSTTTPGLEVAGSADVTSNSLFGAGAWPTASIARNASRVAMVSATESGVLILGDMQAGVAANRGSDLYLGARGTNATDNLAFAHIRGERDSGVSGTFSTQLLLKTMNAAGTEITALTLSSTQLATFASSIMVTGDTTTGASNDYRWNGRARMDSSADGIITMRNASATDFTRLTFGGTTVAFPSLKRNGTQLQFRLADDSGYTSMIASAIQATVSVTADVDRGFGSTMASKVWVWGADSSGNYLITQNGVITPVSFAHTTGTATFAAGATFGSSITVSGDVLASNVRASAANALYWDTRSILRAPADGVVSLLNNAETGFTRLIFGTNDVNGASWVKSGTTLKARTGSDSADVNVTCATLTGTLNGGQAGGTVAPTTGTTANPADINQGSTGATLARSTSSIAFKTNVVDMSYADAEKFVLGLRSVTFNSLCDMDDPTKQFIGAIAEEVFTLDSRFVRLIDGKPVNVFYDWIPIAQNVVLKQLLTRIAKLESRLIA